MICLITDRQARKASCSGTHVVTRRLVKSDGEVPRVVEKMAHKRCRTCCSTRFRSLGHLAEAYAWRTSPSLMHAAFDFCVHPESIVKEKPRLVSFAAALLP
jgi:hypothetical protein